MLEKSFTLFQKPKMSSMNNSKTETNEIIFLVLQQAIFKIDKSVLDNSQYLSKKIENNKKTIIIEQNFKAFAFEYILKILMGQKLVPPHNEKIIDIIETAKKLQIKNIVSELTNYIENHFDDFGIFLTLSISKRFKLLTLQNKCYLQLIKYDYEYLNINKYDLFSCCQSQIQEILRQHYNLQKYKIIKGLSQKNIMEILKIYQQIHNIKILESSFIGTDVVDEIFVQRIIKLRQQQKKQKNEENIQKRNRSGSDGILYRHSIFFQNYQQENDEENPQNISCTSLQKQVNKLSEVNKKMRRESLSIINQINQVKDEISKQCNSSQELTCDEDYLHKTFGKMAQDFDKLEQKCSNVVKKMQSVSNRSLFYTINSVLQPKLRQKFSHFL